MDEEKPVLTIPKEEIDSLTKEKAQGDPGKEAELLTRARILRPLLETSDRLGLTKDQQDAVRSYARAAGERARREIVTLLDQNPVEKLDKILYDVGSQIPEGDFTRSNFSRASWSLKEWAQKKWEAVSVEQQRRELDGEPSSFDKVSEDLIAREERRRRPDDVSIQLFGGLDPNRTEQLLKRLEVIKPNMTLDTFRSSKYWVSGDNLGQGVVGGTMDRVSNGWSSVDTQISGVSVRVVERTSSIQRGLKPETVFSISLIFTPDATKRVLKAPPTPSLFGK